MIDDIPVLDAVVHSYNLDKDNFATKYAEIIAAIVYGGVVAATRPGYMVREDDFLSDWPMEDLANLLFVETSTDIAVNHVLPIFAFKDGLCSYAKAAEANRRWPDRFITYCGVDPLSGQEGMEEMERQVEELNPVGLKLYPESWLTEEAKGWLMDDPEVAFPFFAKAEELGLKVVAIHKAVPLGPSPLEYYRVDDVDRAAIAFPNLNFEVIHGGMAFLEESAWQIARFPNVYVNLEITTSLLGLRKPLFAHALAGLLAYGGDYALDKIVWGTGAMVFHPQPFTRRPSSAISSSARSSADSGMPEMTP